MMESSADNSKLPLPDEMDYLEGEDDQMVDLNDPMLQTIDDEPLISDDQEFSNSRVGSSETIQGETPIYRQNIDESRIDELLVEENLDDADYPDIVDIADRDAAKNSFNDDL